MRWRVPCRVCGGDFCLYEAERLPRGIDPVDFDAFRDLDGQPISPKSVVHCYSCGVTSMRAMTVSPLDWVRIEETAVAPGLAPDLERAVAAELARPELAEAFRLLADG